MSFDVAVVSESLEDSIDRRCRSWAGLRFGFVLERDRVERGGTNNDWEDVDLGLRLDAIVRCGFLVEVRPSERSAVR